MSRNCWLFTPSTTWRPKDRYRGRTEGELKEKPSCLLQLVAKEVSIPTFSEAISVSLGESGDLSSVRRVSCKRRRSAPYPYLRYLLRSTERTKAVPWYCRG